MAEFYRPREEEAGIDKFLRRLGGVGGLVKTGFDVYNLPLQRELAQEQLKKTKAETLTEEYKTTPEYRKAREEESALERRVKTSAADLAEKQAAQYTKNQALAATKTQAEIDKLKSGDNKPTVGQDEMDKVFAREITPYLSGGAATVEKNLESLQEASKRLEDPNANLSGPAIGAALKLPGSSLTVPGQLAFKQQVEGVIQGSLKETLGSQFTAKEGEQILQRAYDPSLPPAENKKKLDRVLKALQQAKQAKDKAALYFQQNGTLKGYNWNNINGAMVLNQIDALEKSEKEKKPGMNQLIQQTEQKPGINQFLQQANQPPVQQQAPIDPRVAQLMKENPGLSEFGAKKKLGIK